MKVWKKILLTASAAASAASQSNAEQAENVDLTKVDLVYRPVDLRPLNSDDSLLFAGHRSHSSHASHRSGGGGGYSSSPRQEYTPPAPPSRRPDPQYYQPAPAPAPAPSPSTARRSTYSPDQNYGGNNLVPSPNSGAGAGKAAGAAAAGAGALGVDATTGNAENVPPPKGSEDKLRIQTLRVQLELLARDLYTGPLNGRFSDETKNALRFFQAQNSLDPSGLMDAATLNALGVKGAVK